MEPGQETAQAVHDAICVDRDGHDQSSWVNRCGTTRCVAGWTLNLHGFSDDFIINNAMIHSSNGVMALAERLLDISHDDGCILFLCTSNDEALTAVEWLARGKKLQWAEILSERKYETLREDGLL